MPPPGGHMNIVNAHRKKDGYGTVTNPERFLNQDYEQLKKYCIKKRVRFVDGMFPPDRMSIGEKTKLKPDELKRVVWLRPREIQDTPVFEVDGVSRFDFGQGKLGDCWFLASIGALTFQRYIFEQVAPQQSFDVGYCGLFHFRFWRFGKWVDVVIDDKLPTLDGKLIFVRSYDVTEFWPALLEKAYAKVCGSYEEMNSGTPTEALVDFTGGVHMRIDLTEPPTNLWELMCRAAVSKALMGCGTRPGEGENTVLPNGLAQGHAYTVTGVKQTLSQGQLVNLVRLWNPWGKGEWQGDWSDRSPLWQTVSPADREMCLSVCNDGEFWMTLRDFCTFYSNVDVCAPSPDFIDGGCSSLWKTSMYKGRWVAGSTAGGCMMHPGSFWINPQYRIKVEDTVGECSAEQGHKNMLVSLMQRPDKRNRSMDENLYIGFSVFEVTEEYKAQRGKFPASFFSRNRPVAQTKSYLKGREMMEFFVLKPGEYLIVPSTYDPNETASFLLTILSKAKTHIKRVHYSTTSSVSENSDDDYYEYDEYDEEEVEEEEEEEEEPTGIEDEEGDVNERTLFREYCDENEEVDAEQLQWLLNEKILKGDLESGGFSTDACRSMVALMDASITGRLSADEFVPLWKMVVTYKDIFLSNDGSQTGKLSPSELKDAIVASGWSRKTISDDVLDLIVLRYGTSSGHITLESFISLIHRYDCMNEIFDQLADGMNMTLHESEWLYVSMYT